MEIGLLEDYAARMVLYLAQREDEVVNRRELSEKALIPMSLLSRIGQMLEMANIVHIVKGRGGGYMLKKKPEEISLLEVIEAIQGKISLNRCVDSPHICSMAPHCPVHHAWVEINNQFRESLKSYNFKNLAKKKRAYEEEKKIKIK